MFELAIPRLTTSTAFSRPKRPLSEFHGFLQDWYCFVNSIFKLQPVHGQQTFYALQTWFSRHFIISFIMKLNDISMLFKIKLYAGPLGPFSRIFHKLYEPWRSTISSLSPKLLSRSLGSWNEHQYWWIFVILQTSHNTDSNVANWFLLWRMWTLNLVMTLPICADR